MAATTWPGYDQTSQTDYSAYYQQQAVAHVQHQNAMAQQQQQQHHAHAAGLTNPDEDDLALVGKRDRHSPKEN